MDVTLLWAGSVLSVGVGPKDEVRNWLRGLAFHDGPTIRTSETLASVIHVTGSSRDECGDCGDFCGECETSSACGIL